MLLKTWWKEGQFRKLGEKDAILGAGQSERFMLHGVDLGPQLKQEFGILTVGDDRTRILIEVYPSHRQGDITRARYEALHAAAKAVSFVTGN